MRASTLMQSSFPIITKHMTELESAIHAAREAGKLLRENYMRPHQVDYKGIINMVTEVDRESEHLIYSLLHADFPEYGFLGEEDIRSLSQKETYWIVDPVDGTSNYARGYPLFAVSIALERNGEMVLGVVYNPVLDELFTAEKGQGAQLNGKSLRVSITDDLGKSLVASGFPYDTWSTSANNLAEWSRFLLRTISARCDGCASLDFCHVACGRVDGYWEIGLDAWDMAAGALIVQEAGGVVTLISGAPFTPYQHSVLASNGHLHQAMMAVLNQPR
jgi:myo-inositol-1(or 4)-monophosphatase